MERFAALIRLLSRISGVFATLLIILSIIVVCQMIFQRVVLGQSTIWQTEFVTFALIAATFVGAPYVLLTRGHVNVDLVPLMLGHRARIVAALLASTLALIFCAIVLYQSVFWWHEAFVTDRLTSSMWRARVWIPYLSIPVGMGLISLQYVVDIWALLTGRDMPFGLKPEEGL
ncbi:MAG TPA: TRAP transporter small permease [Ferrovibrio sp.]|jgi:TRAP-type C4-dicarboxylate transport system permease small subunit|uniref:TRAP transporter small permease n=1 Tax=Ferrovibrio sp. TaxID=1917215 RepID=UPI002B4B616A|nr:TRAP transporter small permease [Ferrovibrio sp.]HLT78986.1 TRAP transporter small permease [Ferrovibrio sp.]